jgi:hypothetical protein
MSRWVVLACSVALSGCFPYDGGLQADVGPSPAHDPYDYQRMRALTTGRMEGFRRVTVDPAAWPDSAKPASNATGAKADLWIENPTSASVETHVNGELIGIIPPHVDAVVKGVAGGTYKVDLKAPNGYPISTSATTR